MSINNLQVGDKAIITKLDVKEDIKRRLLDIGLIEGTQIECALKSPMGNPIAYLIRGALIAIRKEDSKNILVEVI